MHSSKKQFLVLEIAKINLRHNALLSIAVAVLLCLVTPFLIGTANLNRNSAAMPLEMFVSLIGIVLLTPVFQPEQNEILQHSKGSFDTNGVFRGNCRLVNLRIYRIYENAKL